MTPGAHAEAGGFARGRVDPGRGRVSRRNVGGLVVHDDVRLVGRCGIAQMDRPADQQGAEHGEHEPDRDPDEYPGHALVLGDERPGSPVRPGEKLLTTAAHIGCPEECDADAGRHARRP